MKSFSNYFLLPSLLFLSVLDFASTENPSFLEDTLVRKDQVQNVLEHQPSKSPECEHIPTGPIETTTCDYETIESVNDELFGHLQELVHTPFFKYYRVDLYRECPFWEENGLCMDRECGVSTVDESEIPLKWRAAALSTVELPSAELTNQLPGCYYRDSDFCFLDDMSEGDYVDLSLVPERFTGYSGPSAHHLWSSIYEENCFGISELTLLSNPNAAPASLPDTMAEVLRDNGVDSSSQCLEKRVYYKIISGLHASISTHICRDYLNQSTGEWGPNLQCFVSRVASHPERLRYIYFNTVLLLRAIARLGPYLSAYDYCSTGTHEDDAFTLEKLGAVVKIANEVGSFDESILFRGENANVLKEEFKVHFRNVSRIMDCVGCDKCRLWGKVQTSGLGTALKILFELDEKALNPKLNSNLLSRSEVVALINTLHRFVESLYFVNDFRQMWTRASNEESEELIRIAEKAVSGRPATQHPSPSGYSQPETAETRRRFSILRRMQQSATKLLDVCQRSTKQCVHSCMRIIATVLQTIRTIFTSDKSLGLRGDL